MMARPTSGRREILFQRRVDFRHGKPMGDNPVQVQLAGLVEGEYSEECPTSDLVSPPSQPVNTLP